jgi:hypothetical protein
MTINYLKEVDLAAIATPGNPINNPWDPRAHHDFCFESDSQEVILVQQQPIPPQPFRVFISYDCGHLAVLTPGPILPMPGPGVGPEVHGILQFDPFFGSQQPEELKVFSRRCCSKRRHMKVWLDPLAPPSTGQMILVRVSASARGGDGCGC